MPTQIKFDDNAYQEKEPTINGKVFYFTLAYNSSDDVDNNGKGAWYLDLVDFNGEDIISGVKIIPLQNLTKKHLSVNTILDGDLWCMNIKDSTTTINRGNFGTDKQFQLWYYSNEEMTLNGLDQV